MADRSEVYAAIDGERAYQDSKWNPDTTASGGRHETGAWLTILRAYIREAEQRWVSGGDPDADIHTLDTVRKIAGIAVACMEQNGVVHRG